MNIDVFRALHALHSLDVLLSYRAANGSLKASLLPFIMKFALFVFMNSFRIVSTAKLPLVTVDEDVMQDFVLMYLLVFTAWNTVALQSVVGLLKGVSKTKRWVVFLVRTLYYTAFSYFRIQAGLRAADMFHTDPLAAFVALFLFFELNGLIVAYFRRDFSPVFSTLPMSLATASLVALRPDFVLVIIPLLLFRHLIMPTYRVFS